MSCHVLPNVDRFLKFLCVVFCNYKADQNPGVSYPPMLTWMAKVTYMLFFQCFCNAMRSKKKTSDKEMPCVKVVAHT